MRAPPVKSAARVIEVLELFAAAPQPTSLKEISTRLKYPQSSTTVLMKSLVSLGYLNYDPSKRVYFPTLRVTSLGNWIPAALFGEGRILDVMHDIHNATGETVALTVLNDVYVQYIKVIQSSHPLRIHIPEGSMREATRSAAGWLLLSQKSDDEVDRLARRANIAVKTAGERVNVGDFVRAMAQIRRDKWAYSENVPILGAATISVPLQARLQGQPVILGMGGPVDRLRTLRAKALKLLQDGVATIDGQ
jgi:DNA-binding IclR family transcriptional regulator